MKRFLAVGLVTSYGLSVRLFYGFMDDLVSVMSFSFLFLTPLIIGFLTIILIPNKKNVNSSVAFFFPWISSLVILIVTMVLAIEGSICWIMIYPIFSIIAGLGGLIAHNYRNKRINKGKIETDLRDRLNVSIVLFIPLVAGFIEGDRSLIPQDYFLSESVVISASSKEIWNEIINVNEISKSESHSTFANFMGFPKHIGTTLDTLAIGGKRKAIYEKGLYFDETITNIKNEKLLVLKIKTDPNNIPPTVMDEHIVIGGKYVDILEDKYELEALSENSCKLTLSTHYHINTPFNWYSNIWAKYLMSDILKSEINLIQSRAINK